LITPIKNIFFPSIKDETGHIVNSTETQQIFQKKFGESVSKISTAFLEISSEMRNGGINTDIPRKIDRLFKIYLESNHTLNHEINRLTDQLSQADKINVQLREEKRKLEVLYSSGILFTSETEMRGLMETAIDTVLKELEADCGFIVLADEQGNPDSVFAKNMDPGDDAEAMEMSSSVIKNTIEASKPLQVDETSANNDFANKTSILRLGISSVICVPLVTNKKVLGAVYLDRRNKEKPFTQADMVFLLSFAKQIVRGFEISVEISNLEKKLLTESIERFDDLRREFRSDKIIGTSRNLFDVLKIAAKISSTDASVVLLGENGTGKDLLAKAIHENSRRSDKPFVTIDCGSIPVDLLESELFGYESGAFTGATKSKPGKLEMADGGTLFFDEIGEMNINLQAKLLRVIQTKELERLGSVNTKKIDVRIVCATNKNISDLISQGKFREDLYYRLKVIELTLPPLRERREDIAELIEYFLIKHSTEKKFVIEQEAVEVLEDYNWPGNVRELENVILRCVVLAKDDVIKVVDLPQELIDKREDDLTVRPGKTLLDAENEFRRMYIIKTLRKVSSKSEAANLLGINRTHFYKLLSQLKIDL
jgi:transcriptional regulator with GAF, ATPase, and Fis domain